MKLGDPTTVGLLMKKKRIEMGMTLREMAEATGLSFVTLLRLEKGRISYIHGSTAKKLEALQMYREQLEKHVMRLVPVEPKLERGILTHEEARPKAKEIQTGDLEALARPSMKQFKGPSRLKAALSLLFKGKLPEAVK